MIARRLESCLFATLDTLGIVIPLSLASKCLSLSPSLPSLLSISLNVGHPTEATIHLFQVLSSVVAFILFIMTYSDQFTFIYLCFFIFIAPSCCRVFSSCCPKANCVSPQLLSELYNKDSSVSPSQQLIATNIKKHHVMFVIFKER